MSQARAFDDAYHARHQQKLCRLRAVTKDPCTVCGWSAHMAIHSEGNRHLTGVGHEYQPERKPMKITPRDITLQSIAYRVTGTVGESANLTFTETHTLRPGHFHVRFDGVIWELELDVGSSSVALSHLAAAQRWIDENIAIRWDNGTGRAFIKPESATEEERKALDELYQTGFKTPEKLVDGMPPCPRCGGKMKHWDAFLVTGATCTNCAWSMSEGSGCLA